VSSRVFSDVLTEFEVSYARVILAAVLEGFPTLGRAPSRGFVAGVLGGSLRREVASCDGYRLVLFGVLEHHRIEDILKMIEKLVAQGFLETVASRGLVCSSKGRALLEDPLPENRKILALGLMPGRTTLQALDLAIRSGLLEALRAYRAKRARFEDVPEFQVFSEGVVRAIATTRPTSEAELARVPGMGPKRRAAHGPQILEIVAEHGPVIDRLRERSAAESDADWSSPHEIGATSVP
jgi:ATP-dependent DNA helicase RecQ